MFTAYLINRLPSRTLDFQTPFQPLMVQTNCPSILNLPMRVLGCVAFVHIYPPHWKSKIDPRALRYVFLGYAFTQKRYHCYHPPTKKMFITLDVIFHKNEMFFSSIASSLQEEYRGDEVGYFDYFPAAGSELHEEQQPHLEPTTSDDQDDTKQ
ncbi:hypothetical protein EV2_040984 [Malus domestica]